MAAEGDPPAAGDPGAALPAVPAAPATIARPPAGPAPAAHVTAAHVTADAVTTAPAAPTANGPTAPALAPAVFAAPVSAPQVTADRATAERASAGADPWAALRPATRARIGLGRTGDTTALRHVLDFQLAHARARDAVHAALDADALARALAPLPVLHAASRAGDRVTYLCRPDLGRRLAPVAADWPPPGDWDAVFVLADGLAAQAAQTHGPALLRACLARLAGWRIAPVVIATQARVALGDEIGERLGARQAVVLIGERPGLSVADSLGAYLTFAPRPGRRDSERNCLSNIHADGLGTEAAAETLVWLMREAARRRLTGVALKEAAVARQGQGALPPTP
jgi:ethanolamine ammonia-lyase small subunit